jgi:protocatechuate 3,4-dioxygenase beta subunit
MTPMPDEHFDGDFSSDLRHLLNRRALLAGGAGLMLVGCDGGPFGQAEANVTGKAADGSSCIKLPAGTNGPFPADGTNRLSGSTVNVLDKLGVIREDIRPSFDGLTDVADGVPLSLTLKLVNVASACSALAGHVIYLWQCDAAGKYSLYELETANYLRGAAVTDADGIARFTTIFPGCYRGRWPHLHFEVFASREKTLSGSNSLLTSQFAFSQADCEAVYALHPAYAASPPNLDGLALEKDMIFARNTPEQLAALTLQVKDAAAGKFAISTIGVVAS